MLLHPISVLPCETYCSACDSRAYGLFPGSERVFSLPFDSSSTATCTWTGRPSYWWAIKVPLNQARCVYDSASMFTFVPVQCTCLVAGCWGHSACSWRLKLTPKALVRRFCKQLGLQPPTSLTVQTPVKWNPSGAPGLRWRRHCSQCEMMKHTDLCLGSRAGRGLEINCQD